MRALAEDAAKPCSTCLNPISPQHEHSALPKPETWVTRSVTIATTIYISYSPIGKVANHRKIKNPWPKTYPIVKNRSRFAKAIWTDGSTRRHCLCFQTTRRSSREGERSDGKSFESINHFFFQKKNLFGVFTYNM